MKIFIDVSPGFYKTKLFNELGKRIEILVVYTSDYDKSSRNKDFLGENIHFPYVKLTGSKLKQWFSIIRILCTKKYEEVVVGGYTSLSDWIPVIFSSKKKNAVIVESTIRETKLTGYRTYLKQLFFKRVHRAYVCGTPHEKLARAFGFEGEAVIWNSVGLINRVPSPVYNPRSVVKHFLFVGRLIPVKNLPWLIERFSYHKELELHIIGFGEEKEHLEQLIHTTNIHLMGAVNNVELSSYYQKADVFILPSLTETWGLVVEEALNNGLPVMLSNMVGSADDLIIKNDAGVVFNVNDIDDFEEKLALICDVEQYNRIRENIIKIDFEKREKSIINAFVN